MSQKKYQTIQAKNLAKAKRIYEYLKFNKCMSENTFAALYYDYEVDSKMYYSGSYSNLVATTKQFLYDHGIMEFKLINNLRMYVATQKCVRTKSFENATKVAQVTTDALIDKAIAYVEINNNQVPAEFEGPIVANMLGLEGKVWKEFVDYYKYQETWIPKHQYNLPIKYKVIGVVMTLISAGFLKKV